MATKNTISSREGLSRALPLRLAAPSLSRGEIANAITHGVGTALAVVGTCFLMSRVSEGHAFRQVVACAIYCTAMIAVYAASTLSHVFHQTSLRRFFRTLDQAFIYLLIAGNFTPFAMAYFHWGWWWVLIGAMWCFAICGFLSKTVWGHRVEGVGLKLYVVTGWLPMLAGAELYTLIPAECWAWIIAGGLCYTVGTIFLMNDHRGTYVHAIWHLLVIAGSFCCYWAVWAYALPATAI